MLEEITLLARQTAPETGRAVFDERVLAAMARVPRHEFVPPAQRESAYDNRPLPIGNGQTISQPYIVALMTDLLVIKPGDRVLEVGTGSGYQAAVLAALGARVWSVEVVEPLALAAAERLKRLGFSNVAVRFGDGYAGWPEEAPFDAIIVTAAPKALPDALVDQLARGGRLASPIGDAGGNQQLVLVEKDAGGRVTQRRILGVRFVPMTDGTGRQR